MTKVGGAVLKNITKGLGLLAMCVTMPAMSALVHLSGDTVDFYYDDAQPGMSVYGDLSVIGDSIFATPTEFFAESLNIGSDSLSALGTVQVVAKSGYTFDAVQVAQQGDYKMSGEGSTVTTQSTLNIVNNTYSVADLNSALLSSDDFTINDGILKSWSSSTFVGLNTGLWADTSSIDLELTSLLTADSLASGASAFIQNKFVGGGLVTIYTTPVPVPAAIWLMMSGFIALFGMSYKRK